MVDAVDDAGRLSPLFITTTLIYDMLYGFGPYQGLYSLRGWRLSARSTDDPKPRDSGLDFSNRSDIWQAPRQ